MVAIKERDELVAKRVRQSELGWFEACRRAGRETGRQRALNIDADIITKLFRPGPTIDLIEVGERWWNGERIVEGERPIRLQQKNWRLAGSVVEGERFEVVEPDDIVLLHFEREAGTGVWSLTWDLLSQNDSKTASIFQTASAALGEESCVLVPEDVRMRLLLAARRKLQRIRPNRPA